MLLGMGDIHSQLDCKALTDIEGSGAARQGIANCPLDRRNKKPSDFSISVLIQHQTRHSTCKFCATVASLQQPRLSQASCTHCKRTRVIASVVQ